MNVGQLMRRDLKTCRPSDSMQEVARKMWQSGCGSLPMIDGDGELLAIVTDRDLCMAACREGLPPDETPVASMATYGVLTVRENESIEEAELLMRRHHIRRLPVVDAERRPIGIISLYDLAQHAHWAAARGERPTPESVVTTEVAVGERPAPPR